MNTARKIVQIIDISDSDMDDSIIKKLKDSGLVGRGGGCFPAGEKWEMVSRAKGAAKYVVCNASEGEPGVKKDWHILDKHAGRVIDGIKIAMACLDAKEAYIYLNPGYYQKLKDKLEGIIGKLPIKVFHKPQSAGYIGGEETSALNAIERRRIEPRLRPPFPPQAGLNGCPTLVSNVETFYAASLVARGEYKKRRFITVSGAARKPGVFERPEHWTIETVLKHTKNWPDRGFFVQAGGDMSGIVLNSGQLKRPLSGSGSITVFDLARHEPMKLIRRWSAFFMNESCGQCTPCREGTLRLYETISRKEPDWALVSRLLDSLRDTSFCGLGCAVPLPLRSYADNVLSRLEGHGVKLPPGDYKLVCECFK